MVFFKMPKITQNLTFFHEVGIRKNLRFFKEGFPTSGNDIFIVIVCRRAVFCLPVRRHSDRSFWLVQNPSCPLIYFLKPFIIIQLSQIGIKFWGNSSKKRFVASSFLCKFFCMKGFGSERYRDIYRFSTARKQGEEVCVFYLTAFFIGDPNVPANEVYKTEQINYNLILI